MYCVTPLCPRVNFGVHNNNVINLVRGIRERVFAVEKGGELVKPPRPGPGAWLEELAWEAEYLDSRAYPTIRWTEAEFLSTFSGRRLTVYSCAVATLACLPVHRGDADSKGFLKAEKINFSAKEDPAPRLIHPRDPRYNVEVGRYIKRIEHDVYHGIDAMWGHRTVLKGYNARRVAGILRQKWDMFDQPVSIGLDASRFDQHVSVDALKWEHERYLGWFRGHDREILRELLSWQLGTKCWSRADDGSVRYYVDGMRFSGDMNTGLGNCLLMSALVHAWCRKRGVKAALGNNGDDCALILSGRQVAQLDLVAMCAWFGKLGFTLKVEGITDVFEGIEFCQSHPVVSGSGYVMARKHGVAMAKDCISLKPLDNQSVFNKWRRAVGLSGLALASGVPVQQSFYLAFMRGAGDVALSDPTLETGMARLAVGLESRTSDVTPEARYSYWLAFGISPDEQVALEAELDCVDLVWTQPRAEGFHESHFLDLFL